MTVAPDRNEAAEAYQHGRATYFAYDGTQLTAVTHDTPDPSPLAEFVHDGFRALVLNPHFTCVAAKSAFRKNNYRFNLYDGNMASGGVTRALAADLEQFVHEQDAVMREQGFSTFVASFTGPTMATEAEFERMLWHQLQALHDQDAPYHPWDATVSADPQQPDFEFSFGGRALFVVGLHAASSRWTRRYAFPTLVFNAHFQFEELRQAGKYGRMQEVMRQRDTALQGSVNPNLADFGAASDARQYSGRPVGETWACPFHAHLAGSAGSWDDEGAAQQ